MPGQRLPRPYRVLGLFAIAASISIGSCLCGPTVLERDASIALRCIEFALIVLAVTLPAIAGLCLRSDSPRWHHAAVPLCHLAGAMLIIRGASVVFSVYRNLERESAFGLVAITYPGVVAPAISVGIGLTFAGFFLRKRQRQASAQRDLQ